MGVPQETVRKPNVFGVRHVQAIMLFFAMVLSFAMRVNMSMAIVAMTDDTKENSFSWNMQVQSVILSSYFWGYVVLQIPGGAMAAKLGGKVLILVCVGGNSIVSLLLPLSAFYGDWIAVCACRVIQGLLQGFLFPSMHTLIGKWVPIEEKGQLGTLIYAGAQLGTALQLMTSGFIAEYWGWEAIFYVNGVLGLIWAGVYIFLGSESPKHSKIISIDERFYIENSLGHIGEQKKLSVPWKSIVTSLPFFSLIIAHCGHNWGFWTLMTEIPSYMSQVLGVDIKANGVMSALPYIAMYLMSFPFGYLSDLLIRRKWLSITAARKFSNSIGQYGPALALLGLSYAPAGDVATAVGLLTAVVGLNAGHYTGYLLVHIDMSPNFGGILMGITNFFANVVSIVAPLAAGAIIKDETNAGDWRKVFYLSSAIYIAFNSFFVIFGSSKVQKWNTPEAEKYKTENEAAATEGDKTEKVV